MMGGAPFPDLLPSVETLCILGALLIGLIVGPYAYWMEMHGRRP